MKAFLKNYRQSPRKVRLVADLIKGKRVAEAFTQLKNLPKRASLPMEKLLQSAVSNAKNAGISENNLIISNVTVNEGIVLKRSMPRARGSASRINKRTSHVLITLAEKSSDVKKAKKAEVKEVKTLPAQTGETKVKAKRTVKAKKSESVKEEAKA